MAETRNISLSIGAVPISDRQITNPEIEQGRTEKQVEVTKGIEIAQYRDALEQTLVVSVQKHLGAAQTVFHRLSENEAERSGKKFIAEEI